MYPRIGLRDAVSTTEASMERVVSVIMYGELEKRLPVVPW
jgi:hypothetical protein